MTNFLPKHKKFVIIGAGIHGLSTAWHLAKELKARHKGTGADIIVLDKQSPGSGASGIACGVVRNFYFQPAMGEVMRKSVAIWEEQDEILNYQGVGYLAVVGDEQKSDLEVIYERQQRSGYHSDLILNEQKVFDYMCTIFPDWKARGLTACLHEKQGGFAFNTSSVMGLVSLCEREGVIILTNTEVKGFRFDNDVVNVLETNRGDISCEEVVVGVGPWIKHLWNMLNLPSEIDILGPQGELLQNQPMWTFWFLQEGEVRINPEEYTTAKGLYPPVIHIDSSEPLISDKTGEMVTDDLWGIYFKRDKLGVQGGSVPKHIGPEAEIDPYGVSSSKYNIDENFVDYWTSGLAHCLERFEGCHLVYHLVPSGGLGAFSADSFPVFDYMLPNVYVIADSNHGYKMIGVGKEVARVMMGEHSEVLYPFRFERFATGDLHPVSNSPFPWS